jgi:flagellar biosynthesis protein FlhB
MMWSLAGSVSVLLAILGEGKFSVGGRGIIGVSILFIARGIGTGLGPILSRYLSRSDPKRMEQFIAIGFACGALFYLMMPFAPNIIVACVLIICAHLGGATVWVFSTIRLQQIVPSKIRGRVFSLDQAAFLLMYILSTAFYSWLVDSMKVEADQALGMLGASLLIPMVIWFVRMQKMNQIRARL